MRQLLSIIGVTTAVIALSAIAPSASAQEAVVEHLSCKDTAPVNPEPLGDREGHAITVETYSCHMDSGPLSGAEVTGTSIVEWDKATGVILSGGGVARGQGTTDVYQAVDGKITLTITDGKVTGATASGHNKILLGTGAAAPNVGKSESWTSKGTGPGQFETDIKIE
jgi:hypothetical protein